MFEASLAAVYSYVLAAALLVAVGLAMVAFSATANTLVQTESPDHLRGRTTSVYSLVFAGSTLVGHG